MSLSYHIKNPLSKENHKYVSIKEDRVYKTFKIKTNNYFDFLIDNKIIGEYVSYNIFLKEEEEQPTLPFFNKKKKDYIEYIVENKVDVVDNNFIFSGLLPKNKISLTPQESINNLLNEKETQEFLRNIKKIKKVL